MGECRMTMQADRCPSCKGSGLLVADGAGSCKPATVPHRTSDALGVLTGRLAEIACRACGGTGDAIDISDRRSREVA